MKKLFVFMFCLAFLASGMIVVSAETEVEGLAELYEKIWIDYYADQDVKETMEKTYTEYIQKRWEVFSQAPDYMRRKVGYTGTLEEQKELFWYENDVDFNCAFTYTFFDTETRKYSYQYSQENLLEYLFYFDQLWAVPYVNDFGFKEFLNDFHPNTYDGIDTPLTYLFDEESMLYLKDINAISSTLIEAGITSIEDFKVLSICAESTVLYVKSNDTEYMVRIYSSYGNPLPEFEKFKVYTASSVMKMVTEYYMNKPSKDDRFGQTKLAFEEEALSLQSEGLLNGTDKGLDLLKPLTRIETATMLLRAMGEETLQEENVQTFADVSNAHWGYGAAEKAYSLGLVRGVGDNLFAPDGRVTKEQFAAMVLRAGNYGEFNWEDAFDILISEGIISAEEAETMDFFTRGDMAKIIYEAKNKGMIR